MEWTYVYETPKTLQKIHGQRTRWLGYVIRTSNTDKSKKFCMQRKKIMSNERMVRIKDIKDEEEENWRKTANHQKG